MDRDLVQRSLRKLALTLHISTSLAKPPSTFTTHQDIRTRHHEAIRIHEAAKDLDRELCTYIVNHAKAECMPLCTMFQSKLPRELRDMVYDLLLPHETYTIERPDLNVGWLRSLRRASCDHLLRQGFAPPDIRKEIGEMFYELSTFIVLGFPLGRGRNPKRPSVTLDFVRDDRWGLDIDVCQHIRHIHVRLDYPDHVDENVIQLRANLRRLLPLKPTAHIILELKSRGFPRGWLNKCNVDGFVETFSMVFLVLEELVRGGKRVTVKVEDIREFEVEVEELDVECWAKNLEIAFLANWPYSNGWGYR